jgi:alpha-mannosidase
VTALKLAEDGRGAILRYVNAGSSPSDVPVRGAFRSSVVRLDETSLDPQPPAELRPGEIRTIRLLGA